MSWLETNTACHIDSAPNPEAAHHPSIRVCEPQVIRSFPIRCPPLRPPPSKEAGASTHTPSADFDDYVTDTYEWLSMVSLQSPRLAASDTIDPYLCRYEVPNVEQADTMKVVRVRWQGLLPAHWISKLWLNTL